MINGVLTFQRGIILFFVFFAGIFFQGYGQCACNFTIDPGATSVTFDGQTSGVKPGDVICISAGGGERLTFRNITGAPDNYVVIKNCNGEARLGSTTASNPITISGSRYVRLTGSGDSNIEYGIKIVASKTGTQGVAVVGRSSDIEIDHLDITKVGFAGIMAKTDPSTNCADKSAERPNYTMYNMRIHHCYFHEITGEGIYVGNSFYSGTTVYCGSTQYPHEVRGVRIYDNLFESTGWESIQVGSAVSDVEIYNNRIFNYGAANKPSQNGGIQMGLGTTGKLYNNFIKGGTGAALVIQGIGKNYVYNNIVVNPGTEAINVNTRPTPLTTDIVSQGFLGGVYIVNNTIVGASYAGIKENINDAPGNVMYNNLIVSSAEQWDLTKFYNDWTKGNNVVIPLLSDAGFINPSTDDYRLESSSAAVDAGVDVSGFNVTFDMNNLSRPAGGSWDAGAFELANDQVTATASASTQQVVSFSLIDADSEQVIQTISSGSTINLADLPTSNLNIQANTDPPTIGSVKFALSGALVKNFIDNSSPPYALFGDTDGDYTAWPPAPGNYSLTAVPFSATGATGKAGTALKVNFAIINESNSSSTRLNSDEAETTILAGNSESENSISAYPNPFHESINLRIQSDSSAQYVIKFYDNFGKLVVQDRFTPASPNGDTHTMNLPGISSGMHMIVVESEGSTYRKVIKVWKE